MSNRDDSLLYSGVTSATADKKLTAREEQRDKREQDYAKLKPAAEVVLDLIAQEKAKVLDLRDLVVDQQEPEDGYRVELLVRKRYLAKLNALETQVKTTLSFKPKAEKPAAESE